MQLRIDGVELEARTQAPIQAGDRVLLKVLSTGTTPILQVVPATVATGSAADVVNQALRQLLPRQLPTERVLTNLLGILGKDQQRSQLPLQTRTLIETLLVRIPRAEKLADHVRLRQLIFESGLFHEQHQQRGQSGSGLDIKQSLLQLARQLRLSQPQSQLQAQSQQQSQQIQAQATQTRLPVSEPVRAPLTSAVATTSSQISNSPISTNPNSTAGVADELYLQASSQSFLQELQRLVEGGSHEFCCSRPRACRKPIRTMYAGCLISLGLIPRSLLRIKQSMVAIYTLKVAEMGDER